MSKQRTIVEQKLHFLQSRKQFLSRGITPSERLRTIADNGGIDLGIVKAALGKVNRDLKQHSRRVYSRQMIEHVVEQIDLLYWEVGAQHDDNIEADTSSNVTDDTVALHQSADLTLDANIAKLPRTWPDRDSDITQDAYLASLARLQSLSVRRQTLENNLNTYRTLLALLEPYRKPKENIQPNLVGRDAPLAPELMKTRSLAIRVTGRVSERFGDIQVPATAEDEEDVDMSGLGEERRRKVDSVLASW